MNILLKVLWNLIFQLTGLDISFDVNYNDWSFYLIELTADYQGVKEMLAARQLIPKESAPGETRLQIVACQMRSVQIAGSYHEVSFQVPVKSFEDSDDEIFTHLYLPVSTEAARWAGVDIYGFPKFVAKIDFSNADNQITCQLSEKDESILVLSLEDQVPTSRKQTRWLFYGDRKQQIYKTVFDLEGSFLEQQANQNVKFVLGEHPIAEKLKGLLLSDQVKRTMIGKDVSGVLRKPVRVHAGRL